MKIPTCECAEIRPGMMVLPLYSTTSAPSGAEGALTGKNRLKWLRASYHASQPYCSERSRKYLKRFWERG
jgi:hypothetical protein